MINTVCKICLFCAKDYTCHYNEKDRSKYCSRKCLGKGAKKRSNNVVTLCGLCKKEIKVPCSRLKQNKKGVIYCNHKCQSQAMKTGIATYGFKKRVKNKDYKKNYKYKVKTIRGIRVYEHRWIMEQSIGRKLNSKELIHHINGDTKDNRIENLMIVNNVSHGKIEFQLSERLHR